MRFTLTIDMDTDAFGEEPETRGQEISRILRELAEQYEQVGAYAGRHKLVVFDGNDNSVGSVKVSRKAGT